ncbi:hypothetical protein [Parasphingorhabdus sp.]|uniref:hypothetical protein n=1 Tax=Parasphingorhabdus sp. TaxID=2709688 RepID=UPI003A8FD0B3
MRLPPEMQANIDAMHRAKQEAEKLEGEARIEKARITGEPLRERYPNRAAYRRALSKWRRGQ